MINSDDRWITLDVKVSRNSQEIAMDHAMALGGTAIVEKDGKFQVSYPDDDPGRMALTELRTYLHTIDSDVSVNETIVQRENWNREWQKFFKPVSISETILILPEWENPDSFDQSIITRIRPAMAFGTGTHETTQLCLKLLGKSVKAGDSVLDLGTGSGILGITALHLGANHVDGIDIDPAVGENALENIELNGMIGKFDLQITEQPELNDPYDLLVVNMVRARLLPILPAYYGRVHPRGTVVISGLLGAEDEEFREFLQDSPLIVEEQIAMNEWNGYRCSIKQ